jgi:large subunit ribosomal protein L25
MEVTLRAEPRTSTGKGSARQARMKGRVPAILYGRGMDPTPLAVDSKQISHALHTEAGANVLVNLEIEGGRRFLTMVREVQRHPVRGTLLHVDFVNTDRDVKTHADVAIHITGESQGVREGGVIEHHLWDLRVEALPTDIPSYLEADITNLGIGDHLRVADVTAPPGVDIVSEPEEIILSIVEPQAARGAAEEEGVEAAAGEGEAPGES